MKPAPFEYCVPRTVEEAIALLALHGADAKPLAGGQSLVPMLALRLARPSALIDLNRIVELSGIRVIDGMLCVGAMTRQVDVLRSEVIVAHAPLLVQALRFVGHPPTRARGTFGGSLAHADPAAELPAALLALDGTLVVRNTHGVRAIQAAKFFRGPFSTAMEDGELLVEIRIPLCGAGGSAFKEIAPREGDFALASVAVRLEFDEERRCRLARVVLSAVGPNSPVRCPAVEERLLGENLHEALIAEAAAAVPGEKIEFDTWMASRAYRTRVAPVLARRAIAAAAGLPEHSS